MSAKITLKRTAEGVYELNLLGVMPNNKDAVYTGTSQEIFKEVNRLVAHWFTLTLKNNLSISVRATPKRTLRFWNGRGTGKYTGFHMNVAACSQKQAAALVGKACGMFGSVGVHEIRVYYADCWGNDMAGIKPTEPCVYVSGGTYYKPKKLL